MAALKASTTACEQFFSHSLQGLYCDLSGRPESSAFFWENEFH